MLKIFADECVHIDLISALKQGGHNVKTARDSGFAGADDYAIFMFAAKDERILLTFDRGFGDVFRFNIKQSKVIVIILVGQMDREEIINNTLSFFAFIAEHNIGGKLAIVGRNRIRIIGK